MANVLTSRRRRLSPADIAALDASVHGGVHASWLEFLLEYNVAVPARPRFHARGEDFHVNHFLGISAVESEDCYSMLDFYDERLAPGHLPVADADGGNLVCMARDTGRIYFWDHERHDRSYGEDEGEADGEGAAGDGGEDVEANEPPVEVAASLTEFIDVLVEAEPPSAPAPPEPGSRVVRKSADFDDLFKDYLDK